MKKPADFCLYIYIYIYIYIYKYIYIYIFFFCGGITVKKISQTVLLVLVVYFLNHIHLSVKCIIKYFIILNVVNV